LVRSIEVNRIVGERVLGVYLTVEEGTAFKTVKQNGKQTHFGFKAYFSIRG
jgi:hypothetical protein